MRKITITALLVVITCGLTACNTATQAPTPTLLASPTTPPLPTSTSTPVANQVEFVWSITGDPNPWIVPADIATDAQGNLYVVDAENDRIQVLDSDGNFLLMWGETGNGEGQFNFARSDGNYIGAVALDDEGNVYVADNVNQRIQKFDANGNFLMQWGSKGTADGQFLSPIGVVVNSQGDVYVIDDSRDDVQKFDEEGNFLLKWGGHGIKEGQFNYTGKMTMDDLGNIYVADFANHRVQKFDGQGTFLMKWGTFGKDTGQFNDPVGIAVDQQGNVYVCEYAAHPPETFRCQMFDDEGNFLLTWGGPGQGDGQFTHPLAVAVDGQGFIYVSDETNRIQKFRLK